MIVLRAAIASRSDRRVRKSVNYLYKREKKYRIVYVHGKLSRTSEKETSDYLLRDERVCVFESTLETF